MVFQHLTFWERQSKDQKKLLLIILTQTLLTKVQYVYGFVAIDANAVSGSVQAMVQIFALAISYFAMNLATQSKDEAFTYGYGRLETLAALVSSFCVIFDSLCNTCEALIDSFFGSESAHARASFLIRIGMVRSFVDFAGLTTFASEARNLLRRSFQNKLSQSSAHSQNIAAVVLQLLASLLSGTVFALMNGSDKWLPQFDYFRLELPILVGINIVLVFLSAPVFASAANIVLLHVPLEARCMLEACRQEVGKLDGIAEVISWNFWILTHGQPLVGNVTVKLHPEADEEEVLKSVRELCEEVTGDLVIQVVREQPLDRILLASSNPEPT